MELIMKKVLILTWLATAMIVQAAEVRRPNIVILFADQWRAAATGYAGDPNVKTPNLDRLAKESLNFRNAISVCPVCGPQRASLMTGRYPTSTGMFLNDLSLPSEELCMAEIFGAAGYATAYIGKWHLDGQGRDSYIPPERRQGWQYWKAAECDHNYNRSHYYTGTSDQKHFWDGYDAFAQTKDAQQYLRDHARTNAPFVLMVAYGGPHFPHGTAPAEFLAMYPVDKIQLPPSVPAAMQANARKEAQGYYAHCTAVDKCVGDILATLAETGQAKDTIVIFSADHGEMLGSQGVPPKKKQAPWTESANVPFLLRDPLLTNSAARVVSMPLTSPDILPTLLGLAGVAIPKTIEGEDLSRFISSGSTTNDRAVLYMNVAPFGMGEFGREYRALRTDRYTYVRGIDGPWLLYDDQRDPFQTNNLVAKAEHAALQKGLDARLQSELKRIGDDFRPAKNYLKQWGYQVNPQGEIPYGPNAKRQSPKHKPR
jgi:arylsulfatase A-like enzyme